MNPALSLNPDAFLGVKLHGQTRLSQKLDALAKRVEDALEEEVFRAAKTIEETARQSMMSDDVQASVPGMPPNRRSGHLASSISSQRDVRFQATVGSRGDAPYGLWLEYGTSTTAPRPWLGPALRESLPAIFEDVQQHLRKAVRDITVRGVSVNKEIPHE